MQGTEASPQVLRRALTPFLAAGVWGALGVNGMGEGWEERGDRLTHSTNISYPLLPGIVLGLETQRSSDRPTLGISGSRAGSLGGPLEHGSLGATLRASDSVSP